MFVDQARIRVYAGSGGDGCVAFRREKFVPRGGPSGGDGGHGGSVILVASSELNTLIDLPNRSIFRAENGKPGSGSNRHGAKGADCVVRVPIGTLVKDADSGLLLRDLSADGMHVVAAQGGRGGRGNKSFATSTNRTPRTAMPGGDGEERVLLLELKLMADVGLVGLPNAGKSTLLGRLSAARPKIADYPFTTLEPQLGIVRAGEFQSFVMADIPGLIEGAHSGAGLGDQFLRHIERTRILAHIVDLVPPEGSPDPVTAYRTIRGELSAYGHGLAEKPEVVVANKTDCSGAEANLEELRAAIEVPVATISALRGEGLSALVALLGNTLKGINVTQPE